MRVGTGQQRLGTAMKSAKGAGFTSKQKKFDPLAAKGKIISTNSENRTRTRA